MSTEKLTLNEELIELTEERDKLQAKPDELALKIPTPEVKDHIQANLRNVMELRRINRYD